MRRLRNLLEAVLLVEARLILRGAEAHGAEAVRPCTIEQRLEELRACTAPAVTRDDGDSQLRRLLVDEPEAGLLLGEEAEPRCAVWVRALEREHAGVPAAPPVLDVAVHGPLRVLAEAPVVRVAEH